MRYRILVCLEGGYLPSSEVYPYIVDNKDEAITALLSELNYSKPHCLEEYRKCNCGCAEKEREARKEAVAMSDSGVSISYNGYVHEAEPIVAE